MSVQLYDFWRSSAAYRVRIGLELKGVPAERVTIDLPTGRHRAAPYRELNPQALVPTLVEGEDSVPQSLAILEYLDETRPDTPFLPAEPAARAIVRAMAQVMACDIHPLANLRVLNTLRSDFAADEATVASWARHWIEEGLAALEALAASYSASGIRCHGDAVTLADICLVPQLYSARRFDCALDRFPVLSGIDAALRALPAFAAAAPERQAGAPGVRQG